VSNLDPAPEAITLAPGVHHAHSEESPSGRPAVLHGLQLWIALPQQDRFTEPRFAHHGGLPVVREGRGDGATVTVVIGEHRGERSPAEVFTPLVALEVAVPGGDEAVLPVREDFEYGVIAADHSAMVADALIAPGQLAHLPAGRSEIRFSPAGGRRPARFFVVGAGHLLLKSAPPAQGQPELHPLPQRHAGQAVYARA